MLRIARMVRISAIALGFIVAAPLQAQTFPAKPLRFLIGYPPGSSPDVLGRIVSDGLGKPLGQPVVVENRPGAAGTIAANAVKTAAPDGYTLFAGSVSSLSPPLVKNNPVDAPKDLQPVSSTAALDWFVVMRSDLGINSLKDLAAYAKANPNKLRFGQPAANNLIFMAAISREMGFPFNHTADAVPYKSSGQALQAMSGNDIHMIMAVYPDIDPFVKAGKVRVIAVLGRERSALLPAVPTATEQGVPLVQRSRHGIWTSADDIRFYAEYAERLGIKPE